MIIHVVKPGESLYSIARFYGATPDRVASENELADPSKLVVGQTLVITEGTSKHKVQPGQSIYTIASQYNVSVRNILAANPSITNPAQISVGQIINIPIDTEKRGTIEVNGYSFPNISMEVLRKTLPYLTYLSIFSYEVNADGTLKPINDQPLIDAARAAGVAPLMVITNLGESGFNSDLARTILTNTTVQDTLLDNVIANLRNKNYYGLDIDFEYIYPENREDYNNFLRKVVNRLRPLGYSVTTALAPKTSAEQVGLLYQAHDYPVHGALADHVILMTYEWGYTFGPPLAVAPINEIRKVLNYAVTAIPRNKIFMGIPNYGYDWTLPYVQGSRAETLSNTQAVDLALRENAAIQYNEVSQAPYFNYYDDNRKQHVVWFEDARSIKAKLELVDEYDLGGVSYWTIGRYFPQNWLVLSSMYDIAKVL
ncbi:MAG TPA: glycosyl hydrolase family 18 protein [Patescibacteria group bacterium]|nr:glycosyl hydrolase family 18 protein [Patescibacteria group bacterium]